MTTKNYRVISHRMVPENAQQHAGAHAVCVKLKRGAMAWGFGDSWASAEQDAEQRASLIKLRERKA